MNKIHKLVWSPRSETYVVAAETARAHGRAPSSVRAVAAVAAGLAGALLGTPAAAQSCAPAPTTTVGSNTSSTVVIGCPNESVVVNAVIDVTDGTALTNDQPSGPRTSPLGSLTITGAVRGYNPIDLVYTSLTGITNSGAIASSYSAGFGGVALYLEEVTLSGAIYNSGSISGDYGGIGLESSTGTLLRNTGTISSMTYGVGVSASTLDEVRNEVGGSIQGADAGILLRDVGEVQRLDNRGAISGSQNGISVIYESTLGELLNAAGATITGDRAVSIRDSSAIGSIYNAGRFEGATFGLYINDGQVTGTVTNAATGVIIGGTHGISMGTSNSPSSIDRLINRGLIEGEDVGIDGHEGSVISNGIDNSGIIRGIQGIQLTGFSSITGGIVNSGRIEGTDFAIRVEGASSLDRIDLTGPSAALIGDVEALTADVNVKSGAVFSTTNAFNVRSFTVEADALLNLTAAPHSVVSLSPEGISVTDGFFNRGTVAVETGTIGRINGNYSQSAGGALRVGVNGVSSHGVLAVSGDATLAPGSAVRVAVGSSATFSPGDRVQGVLTAGGQLTVDVTPGSGLVVSDDSVRYSFSADTSRSANELDLVVALDAAPFSNSVGGTALKGVAANLDSIREAGIPPGLQPVFDRLFELSADELPAALGQLAPVLMGAGPQAGVSALRSMNKIIQSRVESNQGLSAGNAASERFAWGRVFGTSGDQTSQGVVSGFRANSRGVVLGGDAPVSDKLRAGAAFMYAVSDIDSRDSGAPSRLDVKTYELVHYGSWNLDARTDVNYQVDVGRNNVEGVRQILFMAEQAQSDFSSTNVHASLGIGRTWSLSPASSVTPSVRYDYTRMKTKGYTESGAGALNLVVGDSTFNESMLTADVKGSHTLSASTKLVGNFSAGYDFANKQSVSTSAFVGGGTVFETQGLTSSPWLYRAGLGVMHDRHGMEFSLRYDIDRRSSGYTNQTLSARARWAF